MKGSTKACLFIGQMAAQLGSLFALADVVVKHNWGLPGVLGAATISAAIGMWCFPSYESDAYD